MLSVFTIVPCSDLKFFFISLFMHSTKALKAPFIIKCLYISLIYISKRSTISYRCASLEWIDIEGKILSHRSRTHRTTLDFLVEMLFRCCFVERVKRSQRQREDDETPTSCFGCTRWAFQYTRALSFVYAMLLLTIDYEIWQQEKSRNHVSVEIYVESDDESEWNFLVECDGIFPIMKIFPYSIQGHRRFFIRALSDYLFSIPFDSCERPSAISPLLYL